jgi:hypothetical protein
MVVRGTRRNSAYVQQLLREHSHNDCIHTCMVLLSPGDYRELSKELYQTVAEREYYPKLSSYQRAKRRRLLSSFPLDVGKPKGLLRTTVAADPDRYTTWVSDPITQVSDASLVHQTRDSITYEHLFVNC